MMHYDAIPNNFNYILSFHCLANDLTETWKTALDNRKVVGVVFIDFQKAFNTVSHEILIHKLKAMGLSRDILKRLVSYLKDRKQFAVVNGCSSQTKTVTCGVPQGSLMISATQ